MKEKLTFKGLTLEKLRVLRDLHERGSLIDAARGNKTKADQYARNIGELDSYFGLELTKKQGRGLVLTDDGNQLIEATKTFFRSIIELRERGLGKADGYRIGAGDSLLRWIVIPAISSISKNARMSVRVSNLQNSEIVRGLMDRTLDFGLLRKESTEQESPSQSFSVQFTTSFVFPTRWQRSSRSTPRIGNRRFGSYHLLSMWNQPT